mmetsp:Transcript_29626/g.64442  ORF Transcript_29626/g.64442 Transcript_29626/m.64442 type:complete len:357 (-) Transcript_29626:139-1209(-)|eukprot:CAMPEP_0170600790 /NCGR_PEP_ID=MMETSP0224-20130122/17517_1 /TAXON_ID=285029 /ORGANISM="Togula jolla, Strain CCCM 725" /LENGTH=356 /DNA_ID=CAMNT_0010925529 /DNA_START=35 /DNA_END=1105 /DNA_ORIENTATION=-
MASSPHLARKIAVALDWTPNTNHTGMYVALAKGWYSEHGLDVSLKSPADFEGSYSGELADATQEFPTPCGKVAAGLAEFAMNSPEGCVGWNSPSQDNRPKLKAVAAMLQGQTSAIVTLKSSGIDRPSKLDGKVYASYAARFEGRIVQKLIQADGGSGEYKEVPHPYLKVWDLLKEGKVDATWVFMAWEGVEARLKGVELNAFCLQDFGIPYGYAPVLMAHPDLIASEPGTVRNFLAATAKGFEWAAANPAEAAELLVKGALAHNQVELNAELVLESQKVLGPAYLDAEGRWGRMTEERWTKYLDWLHEAGLLTTMVQSRTPKEGVSASLDDLRAGNVGEKIDKSALPATSLYVDLI